MTVEVDFTSNSACMAQRQHNSTESRRSLPNVYVTPPEEDYGAPPWCCFDADKDAQPGAFVHEDLANGDFDYMAHAEDDIFGEDPVHGMPEEEKREDVFVMRSLVQEAEHLKERLKSLELSVRTRSSAAPASVEQEELNEKPVLSPTNSTFSTAPTEQKIKRRKSLFSFKSISRKKSCEDVPLSTFASSTTDSDVVNTLSNERDAEVASIRSACSSTSRKSGFFSRFTFSSKKSVVIPEETPADARLSIANVCATREARVSLQEKDITLKRRFSIFELSRRRTSISSQSAPHVVPPTPGIVSSMNHSSSSLATSSVPLTPDAAGSLLDSPSDSPTAESHDKFPSMDASVLTAIDAFAVADFAASLSMPSSHGIVSDGTFSLDPLHFETLQFNSDDFA